MAKDVDTVIEELRAKPIIAQALSVLRQKLPPTVCYHTAGHTDEVMRDAVEFALKDDLSEREIELLGIAAAYHDTGFVHRSGDNEVLGADNAVEAMEEHGGYKDEEISLVRQMILDTQLKITPRGARQVATSKLSGYLLDADVSNLGRDDFFEKAELVRQEVGVQDQEKFFLGLITFLSCQEWYTPAAKAARSAKKQENIRKLKKLIKKELEDD
ncbi:MAG: hypothetical protein DCC75_08415 [Proteobacteria bacterium]|nr:MAG: hypothetical protein DCC75_08415 [Pseudomonadota bacterium]